MLETVQNEEIVTADYYGTWYTACRISDDLEWPSTSFTEAGLLQAFSVRL